MSAEFEPQNDGEGMIATWSGDVDASELIDMVPRVATGDELWHRKYALWDFSDVETFTASSEDMRELAKMTSAAAVRAPGKRFTAIVATQDVIFGQMRQWEVFTGDPSERMTTYNIFRSRPEAEAWINARVAETFGEDAAPFVQRS